MKITMRNFIFALFAVAGGIVLLAGNARGADDKLPPEVQSLIGMRIPTEKQGEFGRIKNWKSKGWSTLNIFPKPSQTISVGEYYRDNMSIFVIALKDKTDWSMTILDAQVLPRPLLNYDVSKDGEVIWKKSSRAYRFESGCNRNLHETIVGLMQPEKGKEDCTHITKQVKRAWKIDHVTGHISEISPQGVSCYFMDSEYSCEPQ